MLGFQSLNPVKAICFCELSTVLQTCVKGMRTKLYAFYTHSKTMHELDICGQVYFRATLPRGKFVEVEPG